MKVSIITATYNSEKHIQQVIDSIASQNYRAIEWVVVDGASKDKTVSIIRKNYTGELILISEKDNGIYDALNKGISSATGDIIGFLHSDDFFDNESVIEKIATAFGQTKVDGVYGNLKYVHAEDTERVIRFWKSKPFHQKLLKKGWMPAHPTLFLQKEVYKKHGNFDLNFRIAADYDFMLRILKDPILKFQYLPYIITNMRVGGASNAVGNIKKKMTEDLQAIRKNQIGGAEVLIRKNVSKISQLFIR